MTEVQNNAEQLKQAEQVADQLAGYEGIVYDDEFLAHLQEVNQPLLAQFIESQDKGVLKQVDQEVSKWEAAVRARELKAEEPTFAAMLKENGFNPAQCKIDIQGTQVTLTLPCPGRPLVVKSTSIYEKTNDEWLLDGIAYTPNVVNGRWGTLEEVLEDANDIKNILLAIQSGTVQPDSVEPFTIDLFNQLRVSGMYGVVSDNTFEANDEAAMVKMLNKRYQQLVGIPAPAAEPGTTVAQTTTTDLAGSEAPRSRPADGTLATAGADAATAEVVKPIASEADFYASLKGENLTKLATVSGTPETGSMLIKGFTKGTPEYRYSRINHFFGNKGAAKKIDDPTKYELKVNDKAAEWKVIPGFPDGTLVEKGTETRFLLKEADTKIEWKPLAVAAAVPEAPVAAPEVKKEPTKEELAAVQVEVSNIGHDYEILRAEEIALDVTVQQARRKGERAMVGVEKQKDFAARYRALEGRVAALDDKLSVEQVAALEPVTKGSAQAIARLEPKPSNPVNPGSAVAGGETSADPTAGVTDASEDADGKGDENAGA